MNSHRTRGIVLTVLDHGESDKIVTFYSPDLGKTTAIAKGAKRSKKRFVNKLEEFSELTIYYRKSGRGGLVFLSEAELENAFLSLRNRYDRYVVATWISELTGRFTGDRDPDSRLFFLLCWAFNFLETGRPPLEAAVLFHLKLLSLTGYQPDLTCCRRCGETGNAAGGYGFNPAGGTLFCAGCDRRTGLSLLPLSLQTIRILQRVQIMELARLDRLKFSRRAVTESLVMLNRYSRHLLQREIHSWRFVRNLNPSAS